MVNYQNGKIYKIISSKPELKELCYVGSTTKRTLAERMSGHRSSCRAGIISQIYQVMRTHGIEHFQILLIENYPCNSKDELCVRERYWMDQLNSINNGWNMLRSYVTPQETKETRALSTTQSHARIIEEKKYSCDLCNYAFHSPFHLQGHLNGRIHRNNQYRHDNNNLHCLHCNFQTNKIHNYKRHSTTQQHITNQQNATATDTAPTQD